VFVAEAVRDLLTKIAASGDKFVWYGSRESDIIRVETIVDGFWVKLSRHFPHTDPDYIAPIHYGIGTRAEEVILEVRDVTLRWKKKKIVYECFDENSQLFELALEAFRAARSTATIHQTYSLHDDKLSYCELVNRFAKTFA
jgi:hypothetical protein